MVRNSWLAWSLTALFLLCINTHSHAAVISDGICQDIERKREIPYRLYQPEALHAAHPIIIFSHGLGGSKTAAAYLGSHLADHGYLCFHIQHHGSDDELWKGQTSKTQIMSALSKSLRKPENAIDRMNDPRAFINYLEQLNGNEGPLKGHLDLQRIGMAGHSYGSHTTIAAAGCLTGPIKMSFKDSRVKAGILLSPNTPEPQVGELSDYYKDIKIPLFHITGSKDLGVLPHQKNMTLEDRCLPYKTITAAKQYLLVLNDADHATFSGRRLNSPQEQVLDKGHLDLVQKAALAFFNAYVADTARAADYEAYLTGEFKELVKEHRFESK